MTILNEKHHSSLSKDEKKALDRFRKENEELLKKLGEM